jgi:hypothetical protein
MRLVSALLLSTVLLTAGASIAEPPPDHDPFAIRVEGYLGGAVADPDIDFLDSEGAFDGGGSGSAVGLLGPAFLQLDVFGDYAAFGPDLSTVGFGGHLGLVDAEMGSVAVTGGVQRVAIESRDTYLWRVGGEGELYLDWFTAGVQAGYLRYGEVNADGWYTRGLVRFYPIDNLKLEGIGGYAELESDGLPQGRFLVEYRPDGFWLSFFARWEGTFDIGNVVDSHAAVAGVRFYWDGGISLRESDRVYFRESCTNLNDGARLC